MPTYDYVCDACDHKFELFQTITAPVEKKCPQCKKPKLRRLFGTGAALMFKGSGFYITDYRSEGYKKRASEDKPSSGEKSGGGSEAKSEAKSSSNGAAKSETKSQSKSKRKSD